MQAKLNNLLDLQRSNSRVSIDSISSFAGSTKTKRAFLEFCRNLYSLGVRAHTIKEKENEILEIFKSQDTATSRPIDDNNIMDVSNNTADPSKPQNTAISGKIDTQNIADQGQLPVVSE